MIVCVCHRVSDKEIAHHASEGKGFDDIQFELGVASQCGSCEDCAREVIEKCHAQSSIARQGWMPIAVSLSR
jgi:bacterioferritin-associated ferredoxin